MHVTFIIIRLVCAIKCIYIIYFFKSDGLCSEMVANKSARKLKQICKSLTFKGATALHKITSYCSNNTQVFPAGKYTQQHLHQHMMLAQTPAYSVVRHNCIGSRKLKHMHVFNKTHCWIFNLPIFCWTSCSERWHDPKQTKSITNINTKVSLRTKPSFCHGRPSSLQKMN